MENVLMNGMMSYPWWILAWIGCMMVVNTASIAFFKNPEAKFILGVWIPNGIFMTVLAEVTGFTRLLGLSHVIWWTPLVIYLFLKRKDFDLSTVYGKWLVSVLVINSASLVIDYLDVVRWLLGERDSLL